MLYFCLRVFRWRFISVMYHIMWRDLNRTIDIQTMTYINSDDPKMSYIIKRPINVKKFKNKNKVAWCQNKIQFTVLLLYTNTLLCMPDYISSASSDSSSSYSSSSINLLRPPALSPIHQCPPCLHHNDI